MIGIANFNKPGNLQGTIGTLTKSAKKIGFPIIFKSVYLDRQYFSNMEKIKFVDFTIAKSKKHRKSTETNERITL